MLFCALASDYDGTLAHDGRVDEPTLEALRRFKATGKRLILITGRELADLRAVFRFTEEFDAVVVENGAVMYLPATQEERSLAPPPSERFVASLRAKGRKASVRRPQHRGHLDAQRVHRARDDSRARARLAAHLQ